MNALQTINLKAMTVVRNFWKLLTGEELSPGEQLLKTKWLLHSQCSDPVVGRLMSEGASWVFQVTTLMMNSSSPTERSALQALTHSMFHTRMEEKEDQAFLFTIHHQDLGTIYIGPGEAAFQQHCWLLDRNMVLMVKDTLVASFCTKLAETDTLSSARTANRVATLTDFYTRGNPFMEK